MVGADLTHPAPPRENNSTICGFMSLTKSGNSDVCVDSSKDTIREFRAFNLHPGRKLCDAATQRLSVCKLTQS